MAGIKGQRSGGQNAKPTLQLIREGNFRKDRHGARVDASYGGDPVAPRGLGRDGRWLWDRVIAGTPSGILSKVDTAQLFAMCKWWARWRKLDRKQRMDARSMREMVAVWQQFTSLAMQFGLSPTARARLKAPEVKDNSGDPWASMMAARNER